MKQTIVRTLVVFIMRDTPPVTRVWDSSRTSASCCFSCPVAFANTRVKACDPATPEEPAPPGPDSCVTRCTRHRPRKPTRAGSNSPLRPVRDSGTLRGFSGPVGFRETTGAVEPPVASVTSTPSSPGRADAVGTAATAAASDENNAVWPYPN